MAEVTTVEHNRRLLLKLAVIACAMFGFGFALVPLYKQICEATGVNSLLKPDAVQNTQIDTSRWLTVELDSNTTQLPWKFSPVEKSVRVHPGELVHVTYEVRNDAPHAMAGQAIPSYGPKIAERYFKKLECFCFTQQVLAPGESRRMPVVFVVDPALPAGVNTITLSYTFFELNGAVPRPSTANAS